MPFPEKKFYPDRLKHVGLLAASLIFVAIGIWMGVGGDWVGFLCAAFFGLGIPIFTIQMLPGASFIRLSEDDFEFCSLFRASVIKWSDVSEFGIITQRQMGAKVHEMVGWNYIRTPEKRSLGRSISSSIAGMEAGLPYTYGHSVEELLGIMEAYWRNSKAVEQCAVSQI